MNKLKYPKGEIVWVTYRNSSEEIKYIMTSKPIRDMYFLYELVNGEFKKLGKAKTPPKLEETYEINKKLNIS